MNLIETRTIGNLILNKNTPQRSPRVEHFLIPYYQRGYRWEINHVEALLNDIHSFILSKEENYCLQPIVVAPREDENGLNIWEVIDGFLYVHNQTEIQAITVWDDDYKFTHWHELPKLPIGIEL